jgi:hypothetical protein
LFKAERRIGFGFAANSLGKRGCAEFAAYLGDVAVWVMSRDAGDLAREGPDGRVM